MSAATTTPTEPLAGASAPLWRAGLVAAVVTAVANTLVFLIGGLTSATWQVVQGGSTTEVPAVAPAVASVVAVAVGTVALWVLRRFPWGLMVWTVGAVVLGLASVASPLTAAADTWTGVLLALMHVLALAVALLVLRPVGRRPA